MNVEQLIAGRRRLTRFLDLHEQKLLALAAAIFVYEMISLRVGLVVPARSSELLAGSVLVLSVLLLRRALAQCRACGSVMSTFANYCPQCGEEMTEHL